MQAEIDDHHPIWRACLAGEVERVQDFIRNGTNLRTVGLISAAIRGGSPAVVEAFLDNGYDVNTLYNDLGATPISRALAERQMPIVRLLLSRGADVNARDKFGGTPLQGAAA